MTQTHIGKTIYQASALPAANTATAFEALTWVKVEGVQTLPQLGVTHAMIDIPDLQTGFTTASKGAAQGVDTTAVFRTVANDTGQANLLTAAENKDGAMSFKIVDGSGTDNAPVTGDPVEYAQGIVHSFQPNQGDNSTHEGFTIGFRQNDFTIVATEPV